MVDKFEVGKKYRFTGPSDYNKNWNELMGLWKDGKERLCIYKRVINSTLTVQFEGIGGEWNYSHCMEHFEEVIESPHPEPPFIKGHYYKWIGPPDYNLNWNSCMEAWKDGKPRKALDDGYKVGFEGIDGAFWSYRFCIHHFEDVTNNMAEANIKMTFKEATLPPNWQRHKLCVKNINSSF